MIRRSLPERPLIKRHLLAAVVEPDEVFILAEDQALLWKNRQMGHILPQLDGSRTLLELFEQLEAQVSPPEIVFVLHQLNEIGLLGEGSRENNVSITERELALWHALGVGDSAGRERVRQLPIRLRSLSHRTDVDVLGEALVAVGITVAETEGEGAALEVALTDHYHRPELSALNAASLAAGNPWMVCKLIGQTLWVGPIFHPGRTGCLACLQERLRLNRQIESFIARKTDDSRCFETSVAGLPAAIRLGSALAAQEIALWLAGRSERLEGKLLSLSLSASGPQIARHTLVRRPQCPCCGDSESRRRIEPILLKHRPIAFSADGGYRTEAPMATLARLRHHVSPITGVVTWLADLAKDPEGLVHCFSAGHNFALGPDTVHWLTQSLRSRTGGKGSTSIQAQVSAVCEAIERYCGVYRGDEPTVRASYRSLGDRAIHPELCLGFSDRQYDQRDALNAANREGFFHLIPRRLPEDLEIDWAPVWSLTRNEIRYLPAALCYYGHPDVEHHFYCAGDANGCAAGSVIEEAILQAFLELVERDCAAIWWYNRTTPIALDLDSFKTPYITRLQSWYERHGRTLCVLDLTTDLRIPVFAAVSHRVEGPTQDILIGLGAHLDSSLALLRAVTELNQFLPAVSRFDANGNTLYSWPDDAAIRFWKNESLTSQPQLCPDPAASRKTRAEFPKFAGGDLLESLQTCLESAHRAGMEVLVLDQSRPDIELSVARVVVPGLRHFWRRLGPGRLYDIPVRLGWRQTPIAEDDLNPTSIFF